MHTLTPLTHAQVCIPSMKAGKKVLIAAHGNSLRALVKHLDSLSDEQICGLNIPTVCVCFSVCVCVCVCARARVRTHLCTHTQHTHSHTQLCTGDPPGVQAGQEFQARERGGRLPPAQCPICMRPRRGQGCHRGCRSPDRPQKGVINQCEPAHMLLSEGLETGHGKRCVYSQTNHSSGLQV